MSLQKVCRISVMVTRKEGVTEEEFHKYWSEKHVPLVLDKLIEGGVIKYTQYHITPEYKAKGASIGMKTPYDGIAEFIVPKYEDMATLYSSPFYQNIVKPDEEKFVDMDKIVFNAGVDYLVVDDNRAVAQDDKTPF